MEDLSREYNNKMVKMLQINHLKMDFFQRTKKKRNKSMKSKKNLAYKNLTSTITKFSNDRLIM